MQTENKNSYILLGFGVLIERINIFYQVIEYRKKIRIDIYCHVIECEQKIRINTFCQVIKCRQKIRIHIFYQLIECSQRIKIHIICQVVECRQNKNSHILPIIRVRQKIMHILCHVLSRQKVRIHIFRQVLS